MALFALGRVVATPGALRALQRIFPWVTFLYLIVNKSVKCNFGEDPSGYKSLIVEESNT